MKTTLLFHRSVSAGKTEVDVKDGIVTLRGEAASQAQKELTTEYAKDVEGVKDVKNEMTVSKTAKKTPRTTGEKIDDASITAQVKMALLFHRSTSALNTTVTTKHGVVTLGGKAKNAAEKDLVTKLVKDVKGEERKEPDDHRVGRVEDLQEEARNENLCIARLHPHRCGDHGLCLSGYYLYDRRERH